MRTCASFLVRKHKNMPVFSPFSAHRTFTPHYIIMVKGLYDLLRLNPFYPE